MEIMKIHRGFVKLVCDDIIISSLIYLIFDKGF
jgi:hypothetical protein